MADSGHQRRWIPSINLRAASATLGLALGLSLGLITSQSAQAQAFTVLHNFKGSPDGAYPGSGLVQDAAGNLYGTTFNGGKSICSAPGCGTVFKVSKTGKETVLYNFCPAADCTDGILPLASLIQDAAGNLYGTTSAGGSLGSGCYNGYSYGCGVLFKLDRAGYETVLYSFAGGTFDGCYPLAGLLLDKAGNLYGTTSECGASGLGTVFRLDRRATRPCFITSVVVPMGQIQLKQVCSWTPREISTASPTQAGLGVNVAMDVDWCTS